MSCPRCTIGGTGSTRWFHCSKFKVECPCLATPSDKRCLDTVAEERMFIAQKLQPAMTEFTAVNGVALDARIKWPDGVTGFLFVFDTVEALHAECGEDCPYTEISVVEKC